MKIFVRLIILLCVYSTPRSAFAQSIRSNSFDVPYVDDFVTNPLIEPAPEFKYREASGMAKIIPVFAPSFPLKYQAAISYACKLMEVSRTNGSFRSIHFSLCN